MAVFFQFGLCMTALTTLVTHAWPRDTRSGGCSLSYQPGSTQLTDASRPSLAALKNLGWNWMFLTWLFSWTVTKSGSGFQGSGVPIGSKLSTPGVQWIISSVVPSQSLT